MYGPWICPYLWGIACLSAVVAQDAFPVSFTASPPSNVAPGTTLNLTCSFKLVKDDLQYVKFTNDGGKEFFEFIQEGANPPSWLQFGQKLSDDPEVNSVVWVTFAATFCNATSLQMRYGCAPSNNRYEFASAEKIVTLAGPSKELSVNRMKICGSTLESDVINNTQRINVSISNERNQVTDLTLKIDGKPVGSATPKNRNDVCAYGSEILTDYKFTASQEYQLEYSYTSSGNQVTESCKITVKDPTTTTVTTTVSTTSTPADPTTTTVTTTVSSTSTTAEKAIITTTPTATTPSKQPKSDVDDGNGEDDGGQGGLGGGAIAGIIGALIVVCLTGGAVWYFCCCDDENERSCRKFFRFGTLAKDTDSNDEEHGTASYRKPV